MKEEARKIENVAEHEEKKEALNKSTELVNTNTEVTLRLNYVF